MKELFSRICHFILSLGRLFRSWFGKPKCTIRPCDSRACRLCDNKSCPRSNAARQGYYDPKSDYWD